MKIKSIDYYSQRNDDHLGFMIAISKTLVKYQPVEIDVPNALIAQLNQTIENEDLSYKIVPKPKK